MISKAKIKLIRSLKLKKFRIKNDLAVVEGSKIISELMSYMPSRIESIWAFENIKIPNLEDWVSKNKCEYVNLDEMKNISSLDSIPEALALVKIPHEQKEIAPQSLILYLDDVQDPGNVGTILRTAEWFGHTSIICSPRCADRYSTKVIQASMGSVFRMNVHVMEFDQLKLLLPSYEFCYADMKGVDVKTWADLTTKALIVIGNEGQGVNKNIKLSADSAISICGSENSLTESLNASIAAGMIMHTWGVLE